MFVYKDPKQPYISAFSGAADSPLFGEAEFDGYGKMVAGELIIHAESVDLGPGGFEGAAR